MISKTAQYAVRAVVLISAEPEINHGAQEIARRIGAPPNYMGKLLKQLADAGVLESSRGSGGGFRLARPASEITLLEVVDPIDRVGRWGNCFLGLAGGCSPDNPCPIHPVWKPIRENFLRMLETLTIAAIPRDRGEAGSTRELFTDITGTSSIGWRDRPGDDEEQT